MPVNFIFKVIASFAFNSLLSISEEILKLPTAPRKPFGFGSGSSLTLIFNDLELIISSLTL